MKKIFLGIAAIVLVSMSIVGTSWKAVEHPQTQQQTVKNIAADSIYN